MSTKAGCLPTTHAATWRARRLWSGGSPALLRRRCSPVRFGRGAARRGSSEFSVALVAVLVVALAALAIAMILLVAGGLWWAQSAAPARGGAGAAGRVEPALIRYIELVSWPVALNEVRALAIGPADEMYVAGPDALCVLAPDGRPRAKFALTGEPYCLAAALSSAERTSEQNPSTENIPPGTAEEVLLYVGLSDHVEVWSAAGRRLAVWDAPAAQSRFTSLAVFGEDVFVADAGSRVVWHYDRQGALQGPIGQPDPARHIPGFLITSFHFDLAVGRDGLLYVVNPRALRLEGYTFRGDLETTWGRGAATIEGFFGCCNPAHFAVLPDGRFVTVDKGLPHVKLYSPEGRFECVVAPAEQVGGLPADLAADSQGRVLVLDAQQKAVRVFSRLATSPEGGAL